MYSLVSKMVPLSDMAKKCGTQNVDLTFVTGAAAVWRACCSLLPSRCQIYAEHTQINDV